MTKNGAFIENECFLVLYTCTKLYLFPQQIFCVLELSQANFQEKIRLFGIMDKGARFTTTRKSKCERKFL